MTEIDNLANELVSEAINHGRDPREMLQAMRDEGYVDCDDEGFEACVALAMRKLSAVPVPPHVLNTFD